MAYFSFVRGKEADAVVCETPFKILLVGWWNIMSERSGTEHTFMFGRIEQ